MSTCGFVDFRLHNEHPINVTIHPNHMNKMAAMPMFNKQNWEHSGSVEECLTRD